LLCAHTIRRLKPGKFDQFAEAFRPPEEAGPAGWVRFHMLRGVSNPDEVITFGFFDGSLDDLEASQRDMGYQERRAAVEPLIQERIANGVYEVVQTRIADAEVTRWAAADGD
jgi:hypothetical protein